MSDSMNEILELIENNKDSMNSSAYLNLVNGLQELYKRTNGTFTTDYRQMYMDLQKEQKKATEFLELAKDTNTKVYWTNKEGISYGYVWSDNKWYKYCVERYWDGIGYHRDCYHDNGKLQKTMKLDKDFKLHYDNGPALKHYDIYGKLRFEEWYEHDSILRDVSYLGEYTVVETEYYHESDSIVLSHESWYYRKNGKRFLYREQWLKNQSLHREGDLPALIEYNKRKLGLIQKEKFFKDGVKLRTREYCNDSGKLIKETIFDEDSFKCTFFNP